MLEAIQQQLPGVEGVKLNVATRKLTITYDSGAIAFPAILAALAQMNIRPVDSWWFRRKLAWYEYTDRNAAELAHERPKACCNKLPRA
ncbi:heavy-metal-associated domain-containing protein [Novimethylophilus kurashikiensis]|uniref:heavy-metal-associated domain-containing protein n=1 Tax=Novimethylophilus kurashikiensis TaxID=1825523 RepID=UPI000D59466C|nr:heavy-metal-associated domain-containing protein [Novimethylophilus kurashikiensis]